MKLIFTLAMLVLAGGPLSAQSYFSEENLEKAIFNYRQTGQLISVIHYQSETVISSEAINQFMSAVQRKNGYIAVKRTGQNSIDLYCEHYVTDEHAQRLFTACGITAALLQREDTIVPGK